MKRRILIEITHDHGFIVREGARDSGILNFGELLEQVTTLCHRGLGTPQYRMDTKEGWEASRKRLYRDTEGL